MNGFFRTPINAVLMITLLSWSLHSDTSFIEKVDVDKSLLDAEGGLLEQSVPKVLAKAFKDKNLPDINFRSEGCIKAKKIPVVGSFNTLQLFKVTSTCAQLSNVSFIVKEARDGLGEALALKEVENYKGMRDLLLPKKPPPGLLNLALPTAYLSYRTQYGAQRYLAIMPLAPGRVLCDVTKDYRDDRSPANAERVKKAYGNLGRELSNFYQRNMKNGKTVLHGDMHCLNIFLDEVRGLITLIDNETIAHFLTNLESPDDDLLKLFYGLSSQSEPAERKDMIKGLNLKTWYGLAFKSFVEEFVNAFPEDQHKQQYQELRRIFNSDTLPPWMKIDRADLETLRGYVNEILDKAAATK